MANSPQSPAFAPEKTLCLVDGSAYLYRAFHAMPNLTNAAGQATGAIYGITNMLRRLLHEYTPQYAAVVFDAKGKTFRDDLYAEYKANRPPMPDELRTQVELIHQIVKAMGFPLLVESGVEADDVIGTLAVQAQAAGLHTLVFTGDKDMAQLVNPHVSLIDTMKDTFLDEAGVEEKFGVAPGQIIDYLALMGDTSDNVPGVPKVGPKTAVKWLQAYQSLQGVIDNADKIKGKVGDNLRAALDQLALSQQLVTIKCDVALEYKAQELKYGAADTDTLRDLYQQLEFKSWLSELNGDAETQPEKPADYHTVLTQADLDGWLEKLKAAEYFAVDTETTSLDYMQAELVGISFAVTSGEAAYVPVAHSYMGVPQQLDRDAVIAQIKPLLEDPTIKKIGQHIKYDAHIFRHYGIHMQGMAFDTMLESYVLDSTATRHDMDSLAKKYLNHNTIHYEDIAGKGSKQLRFDQIDLEQAAPYAAEDADITLQLHEHLYPKLRAAEKLLPVLDDIEMPLVSVLENMEYLGVRLDAERLFQQSQDLSRRLQSLEQEAFELAGQEFNLGSTKQLQEILFEKMGLPVLKKTPKGKPSTAEEVLQELALDYPLPKLLMEHRSLSKLKSTYTDKLPKQINPKTGRIHTSYHQAVAATGRLSSSDPNLQNIPIRTEEGRRIRQAFIAVPGYQLLAADYSQIELRIMAHLSQDAGLLHAFANDLDVHKATAAEVFNVDLDDVTKDQRRSAKAINFGLIYGMSAFGLAKQLGVSRGVAQDYVDQYFARYPGVHQYMEQTRQLAHDQGYVETVFGRRLYLPEINSRNGQRRQYAERTAINAPMQGTAADIIKRAMIAVQNWIDSSDLDIKMLMQVHDELVFEVADTDVEAARTQVCELMSNAADLSVPLQVEAGTGMNWDEAH